jgi:O-antigen ligase
MSLTQLFFLAAFLVVTWLALFRHPAYGAALYISMLFLSPQMRWWGGGVIEPIRWSLLVSVITALALMFRRSTSTDRKPLWRQFAFILMIILSVWMTLQSAWALDSKEHGDLLSFYFKFIVAMLLLYYALDSEKAILLFMRTYVACGAYFGWIAFSEYGGGRFEGFGGAGLGEANAGALAIVTSIFVGASLFLRGSTRERIVLLLVFPLLLNALITTVSRSGFLALMVGGVAYLVFTVPRYKRTVRLLSIPAVLLLLMVAGPSYWTRMQTLKHAGEQVQGVDTGAGRLEIMRVQLIMAKDYPLGCGAMCTATLSPAYMRADQLTESGTGNRVRSSHNTVLSFLVEHGIPGLAIYLILAFWTFTALLKLRKAAATSGDVLAVAIPALAGIAAATYVGDQFVSYVKFEPRMWFLVVLMVTVDLVQRQCKKSEPAPVSRLVKN